ncbi:MAG: thiol:disulfide interchange protein DsbA [Paraglaciecola sp.]|jgi:thiol:disulfide interchange protein DsbA
MNKIIPLITLLLLMPLTAHAQSVWQENIHYKIVAKEPSAKPQVKEVFSFWCPACYRFEVIAAEVKKSLPGNVSFIKAHVNFSGSASKEAQNDATIAMLTARAMKDSERFNKALFDSIHQERKKIEDLADIKEVYVAAGGDGVKFEKITKSFGIKGQITKNNNATLGVKSVPTIIVNDKYQAIFSRNMTPDQFVKLVAWLLKQK